MIEEKLDHILKIQENPIVTPTALRTVSLLPRNVPSSKVKNFGPPTIHTQTFPHILL